MNRLGIQSLNAGAPDLRLTGDQTQRGTYVQRRRNQMAGGGIMGSNAGSMLVAPTADGSRPVYAFSWNPMDWIEPIKKFVAPVTDIAKKVGQTIIPGGETGYFDLYGGAAQAADVLKDVVNPADPSTWQTPPIVPNTEDIYQDKILRDLAKTPPKLTEQGTTNPLLDFLIKTGQTVMPGGEPGFIDLYSGGGGGGGKEGEDPSIFRQAANIGVPLGIGKWAHDYQRDWLAKQPKIPMDETGINFQTAQEAMDDPNLRFKPKAEYANVAEGGRIGYAGGGGAEYYTNLYSKYAQEMIQAGKTPMPIEDFVKIMKEQEGRAQGGRIGAQEGGLMNLGGMEKDYRQEGGFVPLGGEEKADDVPARLSKNEFVFTADAVRNAGGGDIDAGAEVMENLMEHLEAGGEVSEDSQGLEGARGMFANAQQLEKRII